MKVIDQITAQRILFAKRLRALNANPKKIFVEASYDDEIQQCLIMACDPNGDAIVTCSFSLKKKAWSEKFRDHIEHLFLGSFITKVRGR